MIWRNIIRCICARSIKYNGCNFSNTWGFKHAGAFFGLLLNACFKYANGQLLKNTNMPIFKHANMLTLNNAANNRTARLDTTGRQPTHGWDLWWQNVEILIGIGKNTSTHGWDLWWQNVEVLMETLKYLWWWQRVKIVVIMEKTRTR